jgi:hypothetical protein
VGQRITPRWRWSTCRSTFGPDDQKRLIDGCAKCAALLACAARQSDTANSDIGWSRRWPARSTLWENTCLVSRSRTPQSRMVVVVGLVDVKRTAA